MSKILTRLVKRRLKSVYPRLAILVTNQRLYKQFIIDREMFLFNLKDHDLLIKGREYDEAEDELFK